MVHEFYIGCDRIIESARSTGLVFNRSIICMTIKLCVTWEPEAFLMWFLIEAKSLFVSDEKKFVLCLYLQYMVMNVTFTSSKANLGYFTSLLQSRNKFLKFQILGSVVFEVNTLIARPHLSSFMHNEWCPKFWRKCTTDLRSLHHFLGFQSKQVNKKEKMRNTKREAKHSSHVSHVVTTF